MHLSWAASPSSHARHANEPLRRVYLQNPATSDRPRNEPIEGWLYCEGCHKMSGGQITPPRRGKARKAD